MCYMYYVLFRFTFTLGIFSTTVSSFCLQVLLNIFLLMAEYLHNLYLTSVCKNKRPVGGIGNIINMLIGPKAVYRRQLPAFLFFRTLIFIILYLFPLEWWKSSLEFSSPGTFFNSNLEI